jgi:hypothetical protein
MFYNFPTYLKGGFFSSKGGALSLLHYYMELIKNGKVHSLIASLNQLLHILMHNYTLLIFYILLRMVFFCMHNFGIPFTLSLNEEDKILVYKKLRSLKFYFYIVTTYVE